MMSEVAYFVKDVVGPGGAASICPAKGRSDDKDHHVEANTIIRHFSEQVDKEFVKEDEVIDCADEPEHVVLCYLEQEIFLNAILNDVYLSYHMNDAVNSLRIVIAADEAFRNGKTVDL